MRIGLRGGGEIKGGQVRKELERRKRWERNEGARMGRAEMSSPTLGWGGRRTRIARTEQAPHLTRMEVSSKWGREQSHSTSATWCLLESNKAPELLEFPPPPKPQNGGKGPPCGSERTRPAQPILPTPHCRKRKGKDKKTQRGGMMGPPGTFLEEIWNWGGGWTTELDFD